MRVPEFYRGYVSHVFVLFRNDYSLASHRDYLIVRDGDEDQLDNRQRSICLPIEKYVTLCYENLAVARRLPVSTSNIS